MNSKWRICPTCQGEGTSSAHLGAITADQWHHDWSPEEQEDYMAGAYDQRCERCSGTGKVSEAQEQERAERRNDGEEMLRRMESGDYYGDC